MASALSRLRHAWNAFVEPNAPYSPNAFDVGASYSTRPDRTRLRLSNERSIISSIYTRISIDAAAADMRHVRLDENDRYLEDINSGLNNCLRVEANLDQAARHFRQDVILSMFDSGVIGIVPVDTTVNPLYEGSFDIRSLRAGPIVEWYPRHVKVSIYNDKTGRREEVVLEKRIVAIVENPLYSVMNEPNSTMARLTNKLNMLDAVDQQSSSGKLDLIIQLPYVIKSETKRDQAEKRRIDIENQLKGSQYGIAYTDGTEKITQLNRPAENNLLKQVEYLTAMLYSQLGITEEVMNGTADEAAMINYHNRTIEPILTAIVEAMRRTFLTKTARTQRQSIVFFRDPFKLVPVGDLAEIADKFTRNEILSSNEFRGILGFKPSKEPKADQLVNSNMPQPTEPVEGDDEDDAALDTAIGDIDALLTELGEPPDDDLEP